MRHPFLVWMSTTAIAATGLWLAVATALAQAPAYRAPRTADGKPDLNGIWQTLNTAYWHIEPHEAGPSVVRELGAIGSVPAGLGVVEGNEIPPGCRQQTRR